MTLSQRSMYLGAFNQSGQRQTCVESTVGTFIQQWVLAYGVKELEIQRRHALMTGALDQFHGDPFDRMLIAQAICENMHLVSWDSKLKYYQAPVIW